MANVQYKVSTWGDWTDYVGPDLPVSKDDVVAVRFGENAYLANLVAGSFDWNDEHCLVEKYCVRAGEVWP